MILLFFWIYINYLLNEYEALKSKKNINEWGNFWHNNTFYYLKDLKSSFQIDRKFDRDKISSHIYQKRFHITDKKKYYLVQWTSL